MCRQPIISSEVHLPLSPSLSITPFGTLTFTHNDEALWLFPLLLISPPFTLTRFLCATHSSLSTLLSLFVSLVLSISPSHFSQGFSRIARLKYESNLVSLSGPNGYQVHPYLPGFRLVNWQLLTLVWTQPTGSYSVPQNLLPCIRSGAKYGPKDK